MYVNVCVKDEHDLSNCENIFINTLSNNFIL